MSEPRAAVFLDRDGTLNREVGPIRSAEALSLIPGAGRAVRRLNRSGRLAVVITNQAIVARGECRVDELERIHAKLESLLREEGGRLDGLYYCPHHPEWKAPGKRSETGTSCACRKPGRALIDRAVSDLAIDLDRSWMIGDSTSDLQLAKNVGIRSVLVQTGHAGRDRRGLARPDFIFPDLEEAVDFILDFEDPSFGERRESSAASTRSGSKR